MDGFMDSLWNEIMITVGNIASLINHLLSPLHVFGPWVVLTLLAVLTAAVTRLLNRVVVTRRYQELEREFRYWFRLREEAMKCEDRERGRGLAKNIDQAKLNRLYYDYFFEGFMLGLVRNVLPIFLVVAYVNEYYRPGELMRLFGRDFVLSFPGRGGEPVPVGSVFYYLATLMLVYCACRLGKRLQRKKGRRADRGRQLKAASPDLTGN